MSRKKKSKNWTNGKPVNLLLAFDEELIAKLQRHADRDGQNLNEYIYKQLNLGEPIRASFERLEKASGKEFTVLERINHIERLIAEDTARQTGTYEAPEDVIECLLWCLGLNTKQRVSLQRLADRNQVGVIDYINLMIHHAAQISEKVYPKLEVAFGRKIFVTEFVGLLETLINDHIVRSKT